jgi:hypothetical protein
LAGSSQLPAHAASRRDSCRAARHKPVSTSAAPANCGKLGNSPNSSNAAARYSLDLEEVNDQSRVL